MFYGNNTLKKQYYKLEQKLKIQKPIPRKIKNIYYVVNQNNYESVRESDASTVEKEIETNTNDSDGDDDADYDERIKKRDLKRFIKKRKASHQQPRKKKKVEKK